MQLKVQRDCIAKHCGEVSCTLYEATKLHWKTLFSTHGVPGQYSATSSDLQRSLFCVLLSLTWHNSKTTTLTSISVRTVVVFPCCVLIEWWMFLRPPSYSGWKSIVLQHPFLSSLSFEFRVCENRQVADCVIYMIIPSSMWFNYFLFEMYVSRFCFTWFLAKSHTDT